MHPSEYFVIILFNTTYENISFEGTYDKKQRENINYISELQALNGISHLIDITDICKNFVSVHFARFIVVETALLPTKIKNERPCQFLS